MGVCKCPEGHFRSSCYCHFTMQQVTFLPRVHVCRGYCIHDSEGECQPLNQRPHFQQHHPSRTPTKTPGGSVAMGEWWGAEQRQRGSQDKSQRHRSVHKRKEHTDAADTHSVGALGAARSQAKLRGEPGAKATHQEGRAPVQMTPVLTEPGLCPWGHIGAQGSCPMWDARICLCLSLCVLVSVRVCLCVCVSVVWAQSDHSLIVSASLCLCSCLSVSGYL